MQPLAAVNIREQPNDRNITEIGLHCVQWNSAIICKMQLQLSAKMVCNFLQKGLAKNTELADINEKSISAYENDTRIPPIFNLLEIAQALGVTMEQLCGVAGPKTIEDELLDRIRMEVKLVLTEYKIDKIDKIDKFLK